MDYYYCARRDPRRSYRLAGPTYPSFQYRFFCSSALVVGMCLDISHEIFERLCFCGVVLFGEIFERYDDIRIRYSGQVWRLGQVGQAAAAR